jgi:hypothetical protein
MRMARGEKGAIQLANGIKQHHFPRNMDLDKCAPVQLDDIAQRIND